MPRPVPSLVVLAAAFSLVSAAPARVLARDDPPAQGHSGADALEAAARAVERPAPAFRLLGTQSLAARAASPFSSSVPDGAGGIIGVATKYLPDRTQRLVVQKLDGTGAIQWPAEGVAVGTAAGGQRDPALVSDGAGGVIAVWIDARIAAPGIYTQRIDAAGGRQWGDDGVPVELVVPSPGVPRAAGDGAGGVIVAWHDLRAGQYDVYAQRVDASGAPVWTVDGLKLYTNAFDQLDPAIAPDGEGGAILVWEDQRSGSSDLYGQRLGPTGVRRWGSTGLPVCTAAGDQKLASLANSDTFVVVGWQDTRAGLGAQVYAQRIDRFGVRGWSVDGVATCALDGVRTAPVLVGDGAGGALLAWSEQRFGAGLLDVYAQKVDAAGTVTWTPDGVEVFADATFLESAEPMPLPVIAAGTDGGLFVVAETRDIFTRLFYPDLACQRLNASGDLVFMLPGVLFGQEAFDPSGAMAVPDGSGGCVVAWVDDRATDADVYAQRISAAGSKLWAPEDMPVLVHPGVQAQPRAVADGSGGVIFAYLQKSGPNYDVFARRFDGTGVPLWPAVPVCTAPGFQGYPELVADAGGGAFVMWYDHRVGRGQHYVQHLDAAGSPAWAANGVLVKQSSDEIQGGTLIPDGAGGVIVPFRQLKPTPGGPFDLWIQRVSSAGALTWGDEGQPLSLASNDVPWSAYGIPDGSGGAIVAWETWPFTSSSSFLMGQHVGADGASQWAANGTLISNKHWRYSGTVPRFAIPAVVSDGGSGAIVAWEDGRSATEPPDLYAQRLDAAGLPQWTAGGLAVSTGPGPQYGHQLVPDGSGGAIVAWSDDRLGAGADLVAQRLSAGGAAQWLGGGRTIAAASGAQDGLAMTADGAGGIVAAWVDGRHPSSSPDLYAQRLDGAGNAAWPANGVALCTAPGPQLAPGIAADGTGGAHAVWLDGRDGEVFLARMQHVDASGAATLPADGVTGVLASLVSVEVGAARVNLVWHVTGEAAGFEVERRRGDEAWSVIGSARADGSGLVRFEDRDVAAGAQLAYRLAWNGPDGRVTVGEALVEVPARFALALAAPRANPTAGPFEVEFTLPRPGTATLELLDVRGRRVDRRDVSASGAGTQRAMLGVEAPLAAGIYLVRLQQGAESVARKVCVMR